MLFKLTSFLLMNLFLILSPHANAPQLNSGLEAILAQQDRSNWLNSKPITRADLVGKVVLIEIWTFACPNCINVLPHVNEWYQKYKNNGLMVIGVHTPELPMEREMGGLLKAISSRNITYPVLMDNNYAVWNAFQNQYWPTLYVLDLNNQIVYTQKGEGNYVLLESIIRKLLNLE